MYILCSDLEGVLVPEIWINVAKQTGIDELRLTTRDISDYNVLMNRRLEILKQHGITINDIRKVISLLEPLPGALDFLNWLHGRVQLIIVSDTFREFADPLLEKMGWPVLFCHNLSIDREGNITGFNLRQSDAKRKVTGALQNLNFKVIAVGDSYNDISMLRKAEHGILFQPPRNVIDDNKDIRVVNSYSQLRNAISEILDTSETITYH
ncbi:MAG: bifunctional phosphoserine phosphatase/homoserine phosphotransferase ThrH [Bacteroidales bacterium]|jgi:phosphoserine/homoserine phosphotransferase|nr:bifunctional phosphoserine phosphatase/homoserine phosphotransferase ThrH [Bacteroidales bacterium]MDI9552578.1 bifunctional phosphoserine phosphatase/homoserine phosphotransferase ThrH [Bacteroidota bacterium]MBP7037814.1 bifunctional phosphoserine phosphatase/homoserine phosphotransferase ThrH [Bacteroidales bacterium]MZP65111.1 bifunctional phosphoserine phosphatase/homoserine phosphotransferase ThrH [Bacteroidales bacterium]NLK53287.1 bifunctional phosphoserine phosphatase/homoserine pho